LSGLHARLKDRARQLKPGTPVPSTEAPTLLQFLDQQFLKPDFLAGDQFASFGGFFKRSWRSNDLLWGRLDGLCRIFEALLTEEAVRRCTEDAAGAADRIVVIDSLSLPGEEDSVQEQIEWNRCRTGEPGQVSFHVDGLRFTRPNSGRISVAAEELAKRALDEVGESTRFFEDPKWYPVGSETIADDVPRPVLVELATRAMLVLRDCLVPQIERTKLKITKWRAYRYGLEWPLRLLHGFAQLARFAPTTARVAAWVLCAYSLAGLYVGVKWWGTFVWPAGSDLNVTAFLVLLAVPVVHLLALPELLDRLYPRVKSAWRAWAPVTFLAALAVASAAALARLRGDLAGFFRAKADVLGDAVLVGATVLLSALLLRGLCRWLLARLRSGWKAKTP
jgi:hypothetical protein